MKQGNYLFYAAGACLAFAVFAAMKFLLQTMLPSVDVASSPNSTVYTLSTEDFEPGQIATFRLDDSPVVIWRRDFAQKVQALELLGMNVSEDAELTERVLASGEIEIEPNLVLHFEWFVVSPINTGGYGCIVTAEAGDLGGFFDPCQDVHFDLWGRVGTGPTEADLQVLPWAFADDGRLIMVDVGDAPKLE